jgi:hypothetical protein
VKLCRIAPIKTISLSPDASVYEIRGSRTIKKNVNCAPKETALFELYDFAKL